MTNIEIELNEQGEGAFYISNANDRIAEMSVAVKNHELTVYHTEVSPEFEDQGLAKNILYRVVEYARENRLKVVPLCTFVLAQFQRHPVQFADVMKD